MPSEKKLTPAQARKAQKAQAAAKSVLQTLTRSLAGPPPQTRDALLEFVPIKELVSIIFGYCQSEHILLFPRPTQRDPFRRPTQAERELKDAPVFRSTHASGTSANDVAWAVLPPELHVPCAVERWMPPAPRFAVTRDYLMAVECPDVYTPATVPQYSESHGSCRILQWTKIGTTVGAAKVPYSWEAVEPLNMPERYDAAVVGCDTEVYVFGGNTFRERPPSKEYIITSRSSLRTPVLAPTGRTTRVEMYTHDDATRAWREMPPLPKAKSRIVSAVCNGVVYMYDADGEFESFDTYTRKYKTLPKPNADGADGGRARALAGLVAYNRDILLIGGYLGLVGQAVHLLKSCDTILAFNVDTGKWRDWANGDKQRQPLRQRAGAAYVVTGDDKIWAFGGTLLFDNTWFEWYDPRARQWVYPPQSSKLAGIPPGSMNQFYYQGFCVAT